MANHLNTRLSNLREARKEALEKCPKRPDGVTQCPPRYCAGYGLNLNLENHLRY